MEDIPMFKCCQYLSNNKQSPVLPNSKMEVLRGRQNLSSTKIFLDHFLADS